jgi:hypothetical protein
LNRSQARGRTPAEAELHDNEKRWVQEVRDGHKDQALAEMRQNPAMSNNAARSIFRRAAAKQGLAGLIGDTQFGPRDLLGIWNKATDDEKASISNSMKARLQSAKPANKQDLEAWKAIRTAISGRK